MPKMFTSVTEVKFYSSRITSLSRLVIGSLVRSFSVHVSFHTVQYVKDFSGQRGDYWYYQVSGSLVSRSIYMPTYERLKHVLNTRESTLYS